VVAHQSLGDLARQGRAVADAIFENTSNKVLFRIGGADSAEILARLSGDRSRPGERIGVALARGGIGAEKSARNAGPTAIPEPLFHPNDLMNLAVGEAFMVVQRAGGRELFRGRLATAPDPGPAEPFVAEAPGPARPPLVLEATDASGAEAPEPVLKPTTAVAEAALARMRRSRKTDV
jgi:hypothetical protein